MKTLLQRHRRILSEATWVFAGQGLSALATLVGLRMITEFVPPDVYGTVTLALGAVALAQGLTVGPLMQAVLRYYPDLAHDGRTGELRRATLDALRRPLLIAFTLLAVSVIGFAIVWPGQLGLALGALALFLAEVARSVEITFLTAARQQRVMSLLTIADAWLRPAAAVALVWMWGAQGVTVIAGYLVGAVSALAPYWSVARPWRDRVSAAASPASVSSLDLPRQLHAYALPLSALPLIGWVSGQADRYLIGALAGVAPAGLYAALYGLASKPFLMFGASVELVLRQPYYTRVSAGDARGAGKALRVWLGVAMTGALTMCLLFVAFQAEIVAVLLAEGYRAHSSLMGWIAVGYVLLLAAQVLERVCYAHHDTRGVLWVQTVAAALSILVAGPLVYYHGIEGAAWAVPIYFGVQLLITAARARRAWQHSARTETYPNKSAVIVSKG